MSFTGSVNCYLYEKSQSGGTVDRTNDNGDRETYQGPHGQEKGHAVSKAAC